MLLYYLRDKDPNKSSLNDWNNRTHPKYIKNDFDAIQTKSQSVNTVDKKKSSLDDQKNRELIEKVKSECCSEHIIPPKMPDTVIFRKINLCHK